jgi:putative component of toxin-antitoxin plasmid stabilization module
MKGEYSVKSTYLVLFQTRHLGPHTHTHTHTHTYTQTHTHTLVTLAMCCGGTERASRPDSRQQKADSRQQTADSRQQTADSRQQTADSRQQRVDSRQTTLVTLAMCCGGTKRAPRPRRESQSPSTSDIT